MEFFYVVKATQKSGKEDAVIWFTAKSEARANLQLDVELEDAVLKPAAVRITPNRFAPISRCITTFLKKAPWITWCKRYELQDDGRTWLPKLVLSRLVPWTTLPHRKRPLKSNYRRECPA
jgi:exodeoxyribonuclease VIII